jgi:hypothetical protein
MDDLSYEKPSSFVKKLRKGAISEKKNRVQPEAVHFGSGQIRENAGVGQMMLFMDGHELYLDKYFHSTLIDIIWQLHLFGRIFNELESFFIGRRG